MFLRLKRVSDIQQRGFGAPLELLGVLATVVAGPRSHAGLDEITRTIGDTWPEVEPALLVGRASAWNDSGDSPDDIDLGWPGTDGRTEVGRGVRSGKCRSSEAYQRPQSGENRELHREDLVTRVVFVSKEWRAMYTKRDKERVVVKWKTSLFYPGWICCCDPCRSALYMSITSPCTHGCPSDRSIERQVFVAPSSLFP
jgi:hypothetical protein